MGLGEFALGTSVYKKYVASGVNPGWLVDVTMSKQGMFPDPAQWEGKYNRLLADGSVVTRDHKDFQCYDSGKIRPCRMSVLLFVDPSDKFAELQKSDDLESSASQH